MKQTHRERLALGLPADMQASFLEATRDYSLDGNDPVEAIFAALNEARRRDTQAILEKLATDDMWKSQLREQLAKDRSVYLKTISQGFEALSGTTPKRIIAYRIIAAVIWIAIVAGLTPYVIKRQIRTVDPEFHTMIEKLGQEAKAQKEVLGMVAENQKKTVKFIEDVNQSASITTTNTSVGQVMARYITASDRNTITLTLPDGSGERILSVPHGMTDNEYVKFKAAYMVPKKVK